jgi:transposase
MHKLSEVEISQRLTRLRNLELLHAKDQQTKTALRRENKQLKADNRALQEAVATLKIQVAELQTMVFGKKRQSPTGHHGPDLPRPEPKARDKSSYRRPVPPAHAITAEELVPLPTTCACGGKFQNVTVHERFEEDIPLPELTVDYQAHLVTKYVIERGVCGQCGQATSGGQRDLGGQAVSLGPNIRLLICHLVTVVGLSYAQVAQLCNSLYGIAISDGEIANALHAKHQAWLPAYQQLKANVRASPVRHYDETPWKIVESDNSGYAWVMSAADSPNTVFRLATSRGARQAQALHGDSSGGIHVTDDYGVYRNLSGQQQLCWSHLYRVIRDLRYNANLPKEQLPYVVQWYETFAHIYQNVRTCLTEPYSRARRQTRSQELWRRLQELANQPVPDVGEPARLTKLKAQLLRAGQERLLTCLTANTPCDNNRAERDLRPLVLKRKRSFGSKTVKGAKALSTILSICTTTWKANPNHYFQVLASV